MEHVMPRPDDLRVLGDYPYCNEFLLLPATCSVGGTASGPLAEFSMGGRPFPRLAEAPTLGPVADRDAWKSPDEGTLFWFRWVTGHQMAFLYWKCLTMALRQANAHPGHKPDPDAVNAAIRLIDGYSAMFVYAASCPREFYSTTIRRFMAFTHKAFSGKWASDYRPIPQLIKRTLDAERAACGESSDLHRLRSCFAANQQVHAAVAQKLVPRGDSLRQEFRSEAGDVHSAGPGEYERFDYFFLVKRGNPDAAHLADALIRRQAVLSLELGLHGIFPPQFCNDSELPPELRHGPLAHYWRELPALALAATGTACELLAHQAEIAAAVPHPVFAPARADRATFERGL